MHSASESEIVRFSTAPHSPLVLLGARDGSLRVHNFPNKSFRLSMHDSDSGSVSGLGVSFDGRFTFSVGEDGNVFVYTSVLSDEPQQVSVRCET